jgi:hypothetical protein
MSDKEMFKVWWTMIGDQNPCRRLAQFPWVRTAGDKPLTPMEQALFDVPDDLYYARSKDKFEVNYQTPIELMTEEIAAQATREFVADWKAKKQAEVAEREAKAEAEKAAWRDKLAQYAPLVQRAAEWIKTAPEEQIRAYEQEGNPLKEVVVADYGFHVRPKIGWVISGELEKQVREITRAVDDALARYSKACKAIEEEREQKETLERDAERKRWIEAHGSERLKAQWDQNHNVVPRYVKERAQKELGDLGEVTLHKNASAWDVVIDPSEELLAKERLVAERLVELGQFPDEEDLSNIFEQHVSIRKMPGEDNQEEGYPDNTSTPAIVCDYRPGKSKAFKTYEVVIK